MHGLPGLMSSSGTTFQEELLQLPGWLRDPDSGYGSGDLELGCIRGTEDALWIAPLS